MSTERHKVCPKCGKVTVIDASVCTRCRRKFSSKFEVHNPPPQPPAPSPTANTTPAAKPAKRRFARREDRPVQPEHLLNGHSNGSSANDSSHNHTNRMNGYSTSMVTYQEAPPKPRRRSVSLETAAYGEGLEDSDDRPFWADDPPPPPKKPFFKFVDPHAVAVPGEPEEIPIGNQIISSVWFKATIATIVMVSVLGFAVYKYVNRPMPVILAANPSSMVGSWVTDDGTLTVELHLDQDGTGRVAWHVHGYMPSGISSLGESSFHWAQNAQQKIIFKENTPFDSHTIYPSGIIQNMAEHNSPTWAVDHLNDALIFTWSAPQNTSVTFTGSQD